MKRDVLANQNARYIENFTIEECNHSFRILANQNARYIENFTIEECNHSFRILNLLDIYFFGSGGFENETSTRNTSAIHVISKR